MKIAAALLAGVCVASLASAAPAMAQAAEPVLSRPLQSFNIPPSGLRRALELYTRQTGVQLIYRSDEVDKARSAGVAGVMSGEAALQALLRNTGFTLRRDSSGAMAIIRQEMTHQKKVPVSVTTTVPAAQLEPSQPARATVYLEDIVVTARKREETLQSVPVVASVLTSEALERQQTAELREIARMVPALSLAEASGALGTQVSLRGVGTSAINANIDASVALNVDGLQITQAVSYASAIFDLARVEVLKGPQALFYGKNSPGGVIALHTADPTDKFEVSGQLGYEFGARQVRSQLIVSGPVSDTLKLRLAGLYDRRDGYFKNNAIVPGGRGGLAPADSRLGPNEHYILRGTMIWEPTQTITARLKVNVTHDMAEGGDPNQIVSCPEGLGPVPGGIPFLAGNEDCKLNRYISGPSIDPAAFRGTKNGGVPFKKLEHLFGTLDLRFELTPELTLNSTTGYYDMEFKNMSNGSNSTFAGPTFLSISDPLSRKDYTQELRLQSDYGGSFNFLVGVFYQNGKINNTILLPANRGFLPTPTLIDYRHLIDIESFSAFGQLRWQVTPALELSGGARWTEEKRKLAAYVLTSGTPVLFPTATPKIKSDNIAPEFTANYRPNNDLTIFASYKVAYKSGSFDTTALSGNRPNYAFGDEKGQGWEAGVKARLFDRKVASSFAIYDYRYKGLQVGALEPIAAGGIPVNRTLNATSARVYGAEFELTYRPPTIEGLSLQAAVAYTHARFNKFDAAPCWGGQTIAEGCNQIFVPNANQAAAAPTGAVFVNGLHGFYRAQDVSGLPLVRSPDWQATFGFTYQRPIGDDLTLVLANTNHYSSRYLANLGLRDDFFRDKYFKTDLSLSLVGPNNRWEVAVIGKNLTDKLTAASCTTANVANGLIFGGQITGGNARGAAGADELRCFVTRGRELWVRVSASF